MVKLHACNVGFDFRDSQKIYLIKIIPLAFKTSYYFNLQILLSYNDS